MKGWHCDHRALFEYVEGTSDMAAEIEQHVAGCERCEADLAGVREMVHDLGNPDIWAPHPPLNPFLVSGFASFTKRMNDEDAAAPALCTEILARPLPWRLQHVRKRVGTRTAGIVRELLLRMRTTLESSPTTALEMTGLAIELAGMLDPEDYSPASVTRFQASALRSHGYALSFIGNYGDGLAFADRARTLLEEEMPPCEDYDLARVATVRAVCLQHLGRAEEAAGLLHEAGKTLLRYGDRERSVEARISEGTAVYAMGAVERALEIWRSVEGAPELDELEAIRVTHSIALGLCDLGQAEAAVAPAGQCVAVLERLGRAMERTRSRTVLGRALLSAGRPHEAIPILRQARGEYLAMERVVEAGVAAIELAGGLLVTNQAAEVPAICREVIAELTNAGMGQQAAVALAYLQEALALRDPAPLLIRSAGRSLRGCVEQLRG